MRREVAIRSSGLPVACNLYDVDDLLYGAILQLEEPAVPYATTEFSSRIRDRARDSLKALAPLLMPVSKEIVTLWTTPLIAGAPNQRDPKQMPAWIEALMLAVADAPTGAFSVDTQRAALRTLTFFPSPADIWNVVKDDVACLRKRETTLRLIIGSKS